MCGRYTAWQIARTPDGYQFFEQTIEVQNWKRYNAAPTQKLPIVNGAGLHEARWGITASWSPRPIINATAEKLTGPFWGKLMRTRCLVPANGYYEWDKDKQPWYFTHVQLPMFCFAGLIDSGNFAIITAPANEDAAPVHHRMPVILLPDAAQAWLDPAVEPQEAAKLALPLPDGLLRSYRVSRAVGNVRNDGPELIEQVA